jgi:hypothetical protein
MAIVILFGLLSSTALNMIVVPVLYLRFGSVLPRAEPIASPGLHEHLHLGLQRDDLLRP